MLYLTSIRGIAAFLVVLYHIKFYLNQYEFSDQVSWLYNKGYLAVDFFFILSGFIIAYNYQKLFSDRISKSDLTPFLIKRFARIFPLHAFVMLCFCLVPLAFFVTGKPINSIYSIENFIIKLLLLDAWLLGTDFWNTWNISSWTISSEFFAYLCFPVLAFYISKVKNNQYYLLLVLFAVIAFLYEITGARSLGDNIGTLALFRCLLEFSCGICLYNIYKNQPKLDQSLAKWLFTLTSLILALLLIYIEANHFYIPICFSIMFFSLLNFKSKLHKFLEHKSLVYLGEISYSMYLNHAFILIIYIMLFLDDAKTASPIDIILYITFTFLMSIFTYHKVEVPMRKLINKHALKNTHGRTGDISQ
ncbi:acyltransferase [Catenovulum sp. SM1970]|uniref:acyltransferase family protein n=1 Tax=Marinifaba aquimaris TaxID=2741323 RepID=UPI001571E2DC|nr:acyltransferase [Marinifaba aquimaris]NTS78289.1 acyltransferase [Marinifaba aquimaris]